MKNFSKQNIIVFTMVYILLLIPSFMAAFIEDEGTMGTNVVWLAFAKLFYILRFPTHTLLWPIFSSSVFLYFIGFIINSIFYGLITDRIITFSKILNKKNKL